MKVDLAPRCAASWRGVGVRVRVRVRVSVRVRVHPKDEP